MHKNVMAVIGDGAANYTDDLIQLFDKVVILPPSKKLPVPVASHPDMLICIINSKLICHRDYINENENLIGDIAEFGSLEVCISDCRWESKYPFDCAFNILETDKFIFSREASTAPEIKSTVRSAGRQIINVNQGYAGCSSLFAGGCIISADPAIIKAAAKTGYDTLNIKPGCILLPGYDYGFIGGCGGIFKNTAYFFGNLSSHPSGDMIYRCLEKHNIQSVNLGTGKLTDFGGIKFICK